MTKDDIVVKQGRGKFQENYASWTTAIKTSIQGVDIKEWENLKYHMRQKRIMLKYILCLRVVL
ncbi:MAG: hypothetical protein HN862_06815 [Candidatus Scalindua sp.]|jgi:hypothetical protein|nr:hypothetical protein [Candidatus Scalindua sp.]